MSRHSETPRGASIDPSDRDSSRHARGGGDSAGIDEATARAVLGSMAGSVWIDPEIDLTEPIFDGEMDAEKGILYNE